jgi:two-component system, chemotaxis family, protein-glutamate methylesterase/glutaminase
VTNDIRVLIAEDSSTIRRYLRELISGTPGICVIGEAADGEEAVTLTAELRPDVVSMDVRMPRLDGMEATRRIMAYTPRPVVVVSGLVQQEVELSFQAIQAGALAVVEKPPARNNPDFTAKHRQLMRTLVAMSKVSVVRRVTRPLPDIDAVEVRSYTHPSPEVLAIGTSAGGPKALSRLLKALPADFPLPVVIVQHLAQEFVPGLARWLDKATPLTVQVATDGIVLEPGVVNLSPGTVHLCVQRSGGRLVATFDAQRGRYRYQPSVDVLFESVAVTCGARAIGVILTGMGDDGVNGLLAMRQAGARTFAQDRHSATVFGMPGAAIARGAAEQVFGLSALPLAILKST